MIRVSTKDELDCLFDLLVFVSEEDMFLNPTCRVRVRVRVKVGIRIGSWVRGRPNTVGARVRNWSSDVTLPEIMDFMAIIAVW
jgi:hypothetical protein